MALGWVNATLSDRGPVLLLIGCVLVLTSRRWRTDDLLIAAGVLVLPLLHWVYMDGFYRGTICTEDFGCRTDPAFPDAVRVVIDLVPYVVIGGLAWRLRQHDPLARGAVVPAR